MSSLLWVQLALLAGCLGLGEAEGDPLPPGLVELVQNSPISSLEDLQLLLFSDSVDEDDGSFLSGQQSNNTNNRLPRSLGAQPAQQALCKVRTEVTEVTRAMLDRSNANFLLWPPCVEVQRCSGCCNTKSLQCVPIVTHTRYLQVMKIQYVEKRPIYSKAVVSVHDHVECRCHPAPRPPPPAKKKLAPRRAQKDGRAEGHPAKPRSKEELHRADELKHNQRHRQEDMLDLHRKLGNTSAGPGRGRGGLERAEPGPGGNRSASNDDAALDRVGRERAETRGEVAEGEARLRGGLGLGTTKGDGVTQGLPPCTPTSELQQQRGNSSSEGVRRGHGSKEGANQRLYQQLSPAEETNQGAERRFTPSQDADQSRDDNETPESEEKPRQALEEQQMLQEERKDLLLLHRRLDEEKELLRQQAEEERRQQQPQHHLPHHKHPPTPPSTMPTTPPSTMPTTGTLSPTSTQTPSTTAAPRPPVRPAPPRKRSRKNNRKRISKAAIRAMLM